jgi:hypothetical protein
VTEVTLAEYNNVVKAFPSDRTNQPFSMSILPRGGAATWVDRDAYRSESADKNLTISAVPVTNEIAGSLLPPACFRDLICDLRRDLVCRRSLDTAGDVVDFAVGQ